jgi:hypothetical protein
LEPDEDRPKKPKEEFFQGWPILGKTALKDAARKEVRDLFGAAVRAGAGAKCFDPRHGLRITSGAMTFDLVICFRCSWIYIYSPKKDDPVKKVIHPGMQRVLDKLLKDAKISLAKPAK